MLIRNGLILTMDDAWRAVRGDVRATGGRITTVGGTLEPEPGEPVLEAHGAVVLPGFVQTHVHLCQTVFRGLADDRRLLAWLRERIWPLEAAHDADSLRVSTRLAAAELLLGGTTTVFTMETVHDTDAVFEALVETGLRAIVGKCLMDVREDAPARLYEPAREAIDEALRLHRQWSGAAGGRLRAALAPRFALSCTPGLLEDVAAASVAEGLLVHTHAAEQQDEVAWVRDRTGLSNLAYLAARGLATARLCAAHGVWLDDDEIALAAERAVRVLHCPGSNLKLGSGIAPVAKMRARGVPVSLGADGAACNNALDMFQEMRLAVTLQAIAAGPGALTARDAVRMATRGGAEALELGAEIGTIEAGKRADLIVVDIGDVGQAPAADEYSTIVFACSAANVRATIVDGRIVAQAGELVWADRRSLAEAGRSTARDLIARAGL